MNPIRITEPYPDGRHGFALWALGFRPFYLGGALFGSAAMLAWLAALHGQPVPGIASSLPGVLWHVHEMIFGFAAAIVVGFLLTAVRAWTTVTPAQGGSLAALWLLWLAGRVAVAYGSAAVATTVDVAFLPVCALVLLRALAHAKNRHNVFLPIALGLLAALNLLFHLSVASGHADWALHSAYLAVGLLVLFVTIIGGRIIPSFTTNAIPGFEILSLPRVEAAVMPLTTLAFVLDSAGAPHVTIAAAAVAAALVHGLRLWGWRSWRIGNRPILAILHLAYAWIPLGCLLLALAAVGLVDHSLAIHAFTVGTIGCAIVAMITRTARGHTGRPLVAGPAEIACYALLVLAALTRVFVPWVAPQWASMAIDVSGGCWIAAFVVYCVRYTGWLIAPRVDGKEG